MVELCKAKIQLLVDAATSAQGAAAVDLWALFLPISEWGFLGFLVIARGVPFGGVLKIQPFYSANLFKDVAITVSIGWCPWGTPMLWVSSEVVVDEGSPGPDSI
jgi:hypothetical protein